MASKGCAAPATALGGGLPYTDAFKLCRVAHWPHGDFVRAGDAQLEVDRTLGRSVVRLAGAVPGAASLALPGKGCLGLAGRFLYIQAQLLVGKSYAIHVEFVTADKSTHRLTVSNLGKQKEARMKRTGISVYLPAEHDAWLLLALDMRELAARACRGGFSRVKAVQLCANLHVRTVFSGSVKYDWESLPGDLAPTAAFDTRAGAKTVWIPEEPSGAGVLLPANKPPPAHPLPAVPKPPPAVEQECVPCSKRPPVCEKAEDIGSGYTLEPAPIMQLEHASSFSGEVSGVVLWAREELVFPAGSAIVAMRTGQGGSGGAHSRQRHMLGHRRAVVALALDAAGSTLASAEAGAEGSIRLWDLAQGTCFATLNGHAAGVCCLDLSPDGTSLVSVGVDAQGRQMLVLLDISQCRPGGQAVEVARHATDYNIKRAHFLPFHPAKLLTCGKNSVRLYRLRDGQLRGVSVPMEGVAARRKPYSCGTLADPASTVGEVFTDIAFDQDPQLLPAAGRRAYVATLSGALYQVNVDLRAVEAVYQLHDAAISSLALARGLCFTGCAKGLLRVWGTDFSEVCMEAQIEGPITGVAASSNGLSVAAGTETGCLGVLDLNARKYTTLLRSHTGAVQAVAVEPSGQQFYTGSADGTLRAWDGATRQQLLEFCAPGEVVLCVACHPARAEVACGIGSGAVRVFDAAAAALVQECQQHTGAVRQVLYAQRGQLLLSAGDDGNVCAYDARRAYLPLRFLALGPGMGASCLAVSQDGHLLAVAAARPGSPDQACVTIFHAGTLDPTFLFPLPLGAGPPAAVANLHFLPDAATLLAITADGRLLGHSCRDGAQVACVRDLHGNGGSGGSGGGSRSTAVTASAVDKSGSFLLTGSSEGVVKVWGLHALHALRQQQQQAALGEGPASGDEQSQPLPRRMVRSLPCQAFAEAHTEAVHALAFLGGGEVVSTGVQGALCFWSFHGQRCNAFPLGPWDTTSATVVICKAASPPAAAPASAAWPEAGAGDPSLSAAALQQGQHEQQPQQHAASPAGPSALQGSQGGSPAVAEAGACCAKSPASKLPSHKAQPPPGPFTIQVTAGPASRKAQQVPLQPKLQVSAAPARGGGECAKGPAVRSAEWAWEEAPGARVPPYCPDEQLQLTPPAALLHCVCGFTSAAGFAWDATARSVVHAAGNVLVSDDLGLQQRALASHPGTITAMASSAAGGWHATAVAPSAGGGADIFLHDAATNAQRGVLHCHQAAVRQLAASTDGCWLVSAGSIAEEPLAVWDTAAGELVALGQSSSPPDTVRSIAWVPGAPQPTFFTVGGSGGLTLWVLGPKALMAEALQLPEALQGAALHAVACSQGLGPAGGAELVLGDGQGRVWLVEVSAALDMASMALLAELQGESIAAVHSAAGGSMVAAGSASGVVAVLRRGAGGWELVGAPHQLDCAVCGLHSDSEGETLMAATQASSLWMLRKASADVVLCGHQQNITGTHLVSGALATSSAAGVHVWQLDEAGAAGRAPLVEFCDSAAPSCVSIARDSSCMAAGHFNGALSLYDVGEGRQRWRVAPLQPAPVAGVAMLHRLRAHRVMAVYRSGAIFVVDAATGSVLQHTMQYSVAAEGAAPTGSRSGRSMLNFPVLGLAVCPTDSTLFALLGQGRALVCKATWAKSSVPQTLARLLPAGQESEAPAACAVGVPAVAFSAAHPGHAYCAFPPAQPHEPTTVQLHDLARGGGIVKTLPLPGCASAVTALAASTGDRLLAVGCAGGTVRLVRGDTEAWTELAGHGGAPVASLAFSSCGTKLYSVAGNTVIVWGVGQ